MSSVDNDHGGNDYDDDQINPPENIKEKKRLTYSCDNQFSTNTLFVMVNMYIEIIGALFSFLHNEYCKNNNNIVCIYIRERERTRPRRAEMQTSLKCLYVPKGMNEGNRTK